MRHTKIVATLGPASDTDAMLDELIAAGVDVIRLNFSHGTQEGHRASLERVRSAAGRAGRHVAILQDLAGPKIRIGRLAGGQPVPLAPG
ncbi:MAG: pyruvate kinase, partial [Acidobacteria bacterium]